MLARHSLAWLAADGWQRVFDATPTVHHPTLQQWRDADWPTVVRRREPATPATSICVGVPLPPDAATSDKQRIGVCVALADLSRTTLPLPLDAGLATGDAYRDAGLTALHAQAERHALVLRLYGSCAMQILTGLPYLRTTSDIDLLFYPRTHAELQVGMALLVAYSGRLPLDGEIIFPSGDAVAWKEWRDVATQASSRILVKQIDRVALSTVAQLLQTFEEGPTP